MKHKPIKMDRFLFGVIVLALLIGGTYILLRHVLPGDVMNILRTAGDNPVIYALLFFFYTVSATIALPIPVEIGLFFAPDFPYVGKAIILGAGKALGGLLIFQIGVRVEDDIREWSTRIPQTAVAVQRLNEFVDKHGIVALYILLSIPLMVDTVPLYLFSLFNKGGKGMDRRWFVIANFAGGVTRAMVVFLVLEFAGVNLVTLT